MEKEHELSLKVMRLSKPLLSSKQDVIMSFSNNIESLQLPSIDSTMSLPSSFGNIHLGEYLNCLLVLANNSLNGAAFHKVTMKIELQTTNQRITLYDTSLEPANEMKNKDIISTVIKQEIKETGVHVLICSIHYKVHENDLEKKFFRKFYKFQVINPLSVKTKVNYCEERSCLFLEAQVQNLSMETLFLNQVKFLPSEAFDVIEPRSIFSDGEGSRELLSEDVLQFLYTLVAKDAREGKRATAMGKLDISWCTSMGECGRLQTSMLNRKIANLPPDLQISIARSSDRIAMESPFKISFCINLNQSIPPNSYITFESKNRNILSFGTVPSVSVVDNFIFDLQFIAFSEGLITLSGFKLINRNNGNVQELQDSFELFVYRN